MIMALFRLRDIKCLRRGLKVHNPVVVGTFGGPGGKATSPR
jgi:hypothetical protein